MSDLIDRQSLLSKRGELAYCEVCPVWNLIKDAPTVAASPWHRVEDGLPKETKIVVTYGKGHVSFGYYLFLYDADTDKEVVEWFDYCGNRENVTHWMPLPEPPEEDA